MPAVHETETFQHYQVLRRPDGTLFELGRGAMGVTYKAFDTNLRCEVALKVINALNLDSETARARFLREARAAAGLRHRNVASVYHLGNDDQCFFYAMEWVDGLTVEALVKERGGGIPVADALNIALQVARALGAAARQGLIHRDIKPANLMVAREEDDDDQFVVKVIDFGLARSAVSSEGSANITMGGFVGTPQYASPEQLEEKDLDIRSDIYSLGVTLWYMLAGRPPFSGALGSVFIQQMTKEPPWEQVGHLPQSVRALLAHVLEKNPDKRPQTAIELRREIEAALKLLPPEVGSVSLLDFSASSGAASDTSARSGSLPSVPAPGFAAIAGPGMRLAGRYELIKLAGEGTNGRVFRARDLTSARLVAVKAFHTGVLSLPAERQRLEETMNKLREAPHPCLKQVHGLFEAADSRFLVEEWVYGFSLVDVLRSRGQLSVVEVLQMLALLASATDHARAHQLNRLELGLHQIAVDFSVAGAGSEAPADPGLLNARIEGWPAFSLKLDALGIAREAGDSVTWGGDMTMLPQGPSLGRDTQTSIRGLIEGSYLHAVAALCYEMLSGAPPPGTARILPPIPALGEQANDVLRVALSPNPAFPSETDFFETLLAASGVPRRSLLHVPEAPAATLISEASFQDHPGAHAGPSPDATSARSAAPTTIRPLEPAVAAPPVSVPPADSADLSLTSAPADHSAPVFESGAPEEVIAAEPEPAGAFEPAPLEARAEPLPVAEPAPIPAPRRVDEPAHMPAPAPVPPTVEPPVDIASEVIDAPRPAIIEKAADVPGTPLSSDLPVAPGMPQDVLPAATGTSVPEIAGLPRIDSAVASLDLAAPDAVPARKRPGVSAFAIGIGVVAILGAAAAGFMFLRHVPEPVASSGPAKAALAVDGNRVSTPTSALNRLLPATASADGADAANVAPTPGAAASPSPSPAASPAPSFTPISADVPGPAGEPPPVARTADAIGGLDESDSPATAVAPPATPAPAPKATPAHVRDKEKAPVRDVSKPKPKPSAAAAPQRAPQPAPSSDQGPGFMR